MTPSAMLSLLVRHGPIKIDSNGASESAAIGTGSQRIIEREKAGGRRTDVQIAVGTMPTGGKAVLFDRIERDNVQLPFSVFQGLFDCFHQARIVGIVDRHAVLDGINEARKSL